jgi:hypothetical protein
MNKSYIRKLLRAVKKTYPETSISAKPIMYHWIGETEFFTYGKSIQNSFINTLKSGIRNNLFTENDINELDPNDIKDRKYSVK